MKYTFSSQQKPMKNLLALKVFFFNKIYFLYKCLKFLKDAMDMRNDLLTSKVEKQCLSYVLEIANYRYEDSDLNRGRSYFSSNQSNIKINLIFLNLIFFYFR